MRPAYMINTRSQYEATRVKSWLIRIRPVPRRVTMSSRMARTCRETVTSRAEVGSSAMMISGSGIIIMAIMTRWPMPPESSCG